MIKEGSKWPLDRDTLQQVQEIDRMLSGAPKVRCDRCGREYHDYTVGECPRPGVRKKYGEHICIYCCRRCEYRRSENGGQRCGYGERKGIGKTKEEHT